MRQILCVHACEIGIARSRTLHCSEKSMLMLSRYSRGDIVNESTTLEDRLTSLKEDKRSMQSNFTHMDCILYRAFIIIHNYTFIYIQVRISQGIQHHFNKDGLLLPYSSLCVCFPLPLEINLINLSTFFLHAFSFRLCDWGGYRVPASNHSSPQITHI